MRNVCVCRHELSVDLLTRAAPLNLHLTSLTHRRQRDSLTSTRSQSRLLLNITNGSFSYRAMSSDRELSWCFFQLKRHLSHISDSNCSDLQSKVRDLKHFCFGETSETKLILQEVELKVSVSAAIYSHSVTRRLCSQLRRVQKHPELHWEIYSNGAGIHPEYTGVNRAETRQRSHGPGMHKHTHTHFIFRSVSLSPAWTVPDSFCLSLAVLRIVY